MPDTLTPEMREGLPEPEGYRVNSLPDENDIVFGKGPITEETTRNMILDYPDSVLKFLQGKDLDERPLSPDISGIHGIWRERGLRKDILQKYFLHFMDWPDGIPSSTMLELLSDVRDKIRKLGKTKK